MTQIVTDVITDPTLPRTNGHPCKLKANDVFFYVIKKKNVHSGPKCHHNEAVFFQAQSARGEVCFDCNN